jgi:hypothetical protein
VKTVFLLLWLSSPDGFMTVVEFPTEAECQAVGQTLKKLPSGWGSFTCIKRTM